MHYLRKSAKEIEAAFREKLTADTNTRIDISTHDPYMRHLASEINEQLRLLRKEHHRYSQGDQDLKTAVTNISHDLRTPLTAISGYLECAEPYFFQYHQQRAEIFQRRFGCIYVREWNDPLFQQSKGIGSRHCRKTV